MARGTSRGGFTLVELMVTTVIFTIILAAVSSAYLGSVRLLKVTVATAEMSLGMRDLRDRLLFHAAPPHSGGVEQISLSCHDILRLLYNSINQLKAQQQNADKMQN